MGNSNGSISNTFYRTFGIQYLFVNTGKRTKHSSKGLGYDDVIVINGKNETYGFPTKVEDDPVLSLVIKGDRSIDYAEERRLFYVAMTRTKNRVFFVAPEANPSEFLLELKQSYKNVKLLGDWNEEEPVSIAKKPCPLCGYPMQFKHKRSYGLRLYICTNEPEICGFMTNNYQAGKLSIQKCDKCRDGYLIVKQGRDKDSFLGCTNYKQNGTGCSRMISKQAYYSQMGYKMEAPAPERLMACTSNINNVVNSDKNTAPNNNSIQEADVKVDQESKATQEVVKWNAKDDDYVEIIRAEVNPVLYGELDLNDVVFNIVKAWQNVSRIKFYGMTVFCEVLCGEENKRIQDNKLDKIPEYGIYKTLSGDAVRTVVDWMISEHYILKTKGKYPVLHSTYEGLHYSESITEGKLKKLKKQLEGNKIPFDM